MRLNVHRWGKSGAHLLFLHGMGGTGALWRPLAATLEEKRILTAPDQRGHGGSRGVTGGGFAPSDYASDVEETLEALGGPWPVTVVGHSMGVRTALALAHRIPERIHALVLLDLGFSGTAGGSLGAALSSFLGTLPEAFATRAEARAYLESHSPDPAIAQYLLAVASLRPPEIRFPFDKQALLRTIEDAGKEPLARWFEEFAALGKPVYALRGERSEVWTKAEFDEDRARFSRFPNVRFEAWEGAGHGLPFEKRERLVALLSDLT